VRARTFRVPFAKVAPEALELEWGPDDYLVIRPLLAKSPGELAGIRTRMSETAEGNEADRQALLLDVLSDVIVEWSLRGPDGETIPLPTTWAEVDALPSGLGSALFDFIWTYRGDGPDPTPAGAPS